MAAYHGQAMNAPSTSAQAATRMRRIGHVRVHAIHATMPTPMRPTPVNPLPSIERPSTTPATSVQPATWAVVAA